VADIVLNCTGGIAGPAAVTNIQLTLNASLANGTQPELLIDNPPAASQVPNVNLFYGSVNGTGSILFSGVSFIVPGPAGAHILRITNVQVNATTIPSAGQVVATVSALSSSPSLALIQPQQTVATAGVQLQQSVLSKSAAPANCVAPPAATSFLVSDSQALLWFQVTGAAAGDAITANWLAPSGTIYQTATLSAPGAGSQCFWSEVAISGTMWPTPGAWQVNVYWNKSLLFSAPFSISGVGVRQLIWQNATTRAVQALYYTGSGGTTFLGSVVLDPGRAGWTVVGIADMNGDGVPDLIWQNDTTRQANVNYYGGPGGTNIIGSACLTTSYNPTGYHVAAVADFDGNGTPDLVWENDTTAQIHLIYYGPGATFLGWANLTASYNPSGWHVVAAADFDGNGTPDLVWQINGTSGQTQVIYYGGPGGATFLRSASLTASYNPNGWSVVAAADFDGNGTPDLIWQIDNATSQAQVIYYGGLGGTTFLSSAGLTASYNPAGWSIVGALGDPVK
jgi:hypothetical protein